MPFFDDNDQKTSNNKIFRVRELIVMALKELFSKRVDFTFTGNNENENQIWIMDEENDSTTANQAFPRIVIVREQTTFMNTMGIGHGSSQNFSFDGEVTQRMDGITHQFSLNVKSYSSSVCESLGFIIGWFFHFMEKEIMRFDEARGVQSITCPGFSQITRVSDVTDKNPLFVCRLPLQIVDCDIINLEDKTAYKEWSGLNVNISFACEEE